MNDRPILRLRDPLTIQMAKLILNAIRAGEGHHFSHSVITRCLVLTGDIA